MGIGPGSCLCRAKLLRDEGQRFQYWGCGIQLIKEYFHEPPRAMARTLSHVMAGHWLWGHIAWVLSTCPQCGDPATGCRYPVSRTEAALSTAWEVMWLYRISLLRPLVWSVSAGGPRVCATRCMWGQGHRRRGVCRAPGKSPHPWPWWQQGEVLILSIGKASQMIG